MSKQVELQLMRLLHGELSAEESRHWRRRLEIEPPLAALYADLKSLWSGLETAMPAPADPRMRAAVRARLQRVESTSGWAQLSPGWARALAAAALATGIGLGILAGSGSVSEVEASLFDQTEPSLAESYWLAMTEAELNAEVRP